MIGDRVDKATNEHEGGVVVAVFPTDNGNFRYAVDMEGYGLCNSSLPLSANSTISMKR